MEPAGIFRKMIGIVVIMGGFMILSGCPAGEDKDKADHGKPMAQQSDSKASPEPLPPAKMATPDKTKNESPETTKPVAPDKAKTDVPETAEPVTSDKAKTPQATKPETPDKAKTDVPDKAKMDVSDKAKMDVSEKPAVERPVADKPVADTAKEKPAATKDKDEDEISIEKPKLSDEPLKLDEPKEQGPPKLPEYGPPLVDDVKALTRLDPVYPIWLDKAKKQVVLQGDTCHAEYPLEFFATLRDRKYESVVAIDTKPSLVHAALLATGAKTGHPARFDPEYSPPTGTEVAIEVRWKDKDGKVQHAPAQQWIRDIKTKKAMTVNWVFVGSGFQTDPETGKQRYRGDNGDFIAVLNLPDPVLDIPTQGSSALESRAFEGFVDNMPPKGTPVTIVLMPKLDK